MKWIRDIPTPAPVDDPGVAFLSLAPHDGGYVGAYREFRPDSSNTRTRIRAQRYTSDFELDDPSWPLTTDGEDPRTFAWRGSVWTLIEIWKRAGHVADFNFVLIDPLTCETIYVRHDVPFAGKNWMPVTGGPDGSLYLIRSLEPLVVLRMADDGRCETLIHHKGDIGARRGGANARFEGGRIVGYGHETRARENHVPVRFSIDLDAAAVTFDYPSAGPVDPLTDPTSHWADVVLCSCARLNWWQPQPIVHRLFRVT
jgi:hypothetical protein